MLAPYAANISRSRAPRLGPGAWLCQGVERPGYGHAGAG